jgi:hypothetical protein
LKGRGIGEIDTGGFYMTQRIITKIYNPTNTPKSIIKHGDHPEFCRLPTRGSRCPFTGLSAPFLYSVLRPSKDNGYKPPVKSFSLLIPGKGSTRGTRLIYYPSLWSFTTGNPIKGLLPITSRPEFVSSPRGTDRCPWTGLSRSTLYHLIMPDQGNNWKPPVRSHSIRRPGNIRGRRVIHLQSLLDFLHVEMKRTQDDWDWGRTCVEMERPSGRKPGGLAASDLHATTTKPHQG